MLALLAARRAHQQPRERRVGAHAHVLHHEAAARAAATARTAARTASAFGRGDRERCLLHAQAVDKHSSLLPDHARLELEALIATLEHGRVYDDDDDSKASSLNDLQHFAPPANEKVQTWLRTTLCTDQEGRDVRKAADVAVTDARTASTAVFMPGEGRSLFIGLRISL